MRLSDFSTLPLEIRERIWTLTVDYEPEVCLLWPTHLEYDDGCKNLPSPTSLPLLPLTVDVPFPRAMRICREARAAILNSAFYHGRGAAVRFRRSKAVGFDTPFRLFDGDLDTLYIGSDATAPFGFMNLNNCETARRSVAKNPEVQPFVDVLLCAKNLAIEATAAYEFYCYVWLLLWHLPEPSPEAACCKGAPLPPPSISITLVVPSSSYSERYGEKFTQPGRRCRLKMLSQESRASVQLLPLEFPALDRPRYYQPRVSMDEAISQLRGNFLYQSEELDCQYDWIQQLAIQACTFEEYRGGIWVEACQDRVFNKDGPWVLYIAAAAPVHAHDRPDPELFRPNDADIEFKPWSPPIDLYSRVV